MSRSSVVSVLRAGVLPAFIGIVATVGWYAGRDYQRFDSAQQFAEQLMTKPLGPEAVGFKPLRELPVLKQIEFTIGGRTHKFVVGEIKEFEVKRYDVKSELVLDYNDVAVAEIVRATEMNKPVSH